MQLHDVDIRYRKKLEEGLRAWIDPQHCDCRREVSNTYFGNPPSQTGLTAPCCNLCILKKFADAPDSLTSDELYVLALCDRIKTRKGPANQTPQEKGDQPGNKINVDTLQPPARNGAGEGPRHGDRLKACRNALGSWRREIWTRDFRRSGLMPEAILPDKILSKLATQARLKTLDLIMEEVPGWILANRYGEDVLKVLEPIDRGWIEEAEQKREENKVKRAKQSAENKIRREENARAARRRASDERKAAEQASGSQPVQSSSTHVMPIAPISQPLRSYTPGAAPLAYPSYYPYPYYSVYPYPHSHPQTVLNQGASSSQSASYIPTYPYPYHMHPPGLFTQPSV